MASLYEYDAIVSNGERVKGSFHGTRDEFEQMVHQKKLILVSYKEKKGKVDTSAFKQDDLLLFIEELYYLIKSGMALDSALKTLSETTKKESYKKFLKSILFEIKAGTQLSMALQKALKDIDYNLDSLVISFISTAEEVGSLQQGLLNLLEYLTFQKKIRTEIKQALSYPLFLIGMSIVVSFIIFFLIIPKFSSIFSPEEFEQLPAVSYAVLSIGKYLDSHMHEVFFILGIIVIVSFFLFKKHQIPWMKLFYAIPRLSNIIVDLQLAIVYSALSTMLAGGMQIDRALKHLREIQLIPELSDLLETSLYEIKRGHKLSSVFATSNIIPPSDVALIGVGESSASLDKVFSSLSLRHNESFNTNVKKFLSILEPAVIVLLGVFISFIVVAIMMAVMSMTDIAG